MASEAAMAEIAMRQIAVRIMGKWRDGFMIRAEMPLLEDTEVSRRIRIPHPALRATLSRGERDSQADCASPSGRRRREAPDEGS